MGHQTTWITIRNSTWKNNAFSKPRQALLSSLTCTGNYLAQGKVKAQKHMLCYPKIFETPCTGKAGGSNLRTLAQLEQSSSIPGPVLEESLFWLSESQVHHSRAHQEERLKRYQLCMHDFITPIWRIKLLWERPDPCCKWWVLFLLHSEKVWTDLLLLDPLAFSIPEFLDNLLVQVLLVMNLPGQGLHLLVVGRCQVGQLLEVARLQLLDLAMMAVDQVVKRRLMLAFHCNQLRF